MKSTIAAHKQQKVPNIVIQIEKKSPKSLGKLMYFFMKSCTMSAYLLGVNPFNQPGVGEYKDIMANILGKPKETTTT